MVPSLSFFFEMEDLQPQLEESWRGVKKLVDSHRSDELRKGSTDRTDQ